MVSLSAIGRDYGLDAKEVRAIADASGVPTVAVGPRMRIITPDDAAALAAILRKVEAARKRTRRKQQKS